MRQGEQPADKTIPQRGDYIYADHANGSERILVGQGACHHGQERNVKLSGNISKEIRIFYAEAINTVHWMLTQTSSSIVSKRD